MSLKLNGSRSFVASPLDLEDARVDSRTLSFYHEGQLRFYIGLLGGFIGAELFWVPFVF